MALKTDDILLVQRGTKSYQMPASQLADASFVGGDLQAVTDKGNTTTNYLDIGSNSHANACIFASNNHTNPTLYARNYLEAGSTFKGLNAAGDFTIDLKANGGASFASGVCLIDVAGYITIDRDSAAQNILEGRLNGSQTLVLNADGSAVFGGKVDVGAADKTSTTAAGSSTRPEGILLLQRPATTPDNGEFFEAYHGDAQTIRFEVDGSAEFKKSVTSNRANSTSATFISQFNGTTNSQLYADGSAELINTWQNDATPAVKMWQDQSAASIMIKGGTNNTIGALAVYQNGYENNNDKTAFIEHDGSAHFGVTTSNDANIHLHNDGFAQFAGDVAVGGSNGNQTVVGAYLNKDGYVASTGEGTNNIWNGYQKDTAAQTSVITANGQATFNARVSGTMTAIDSTGAWDAKDSNFWTVAGPTLSNPSNRTSGQTGVFYCTGEVNAFGNHFSFSGGVTPTIPANSVVPYFVDATEKIRLGIATEAFV